MHHSHAHCNDSRSIHSQSATPGPPNPQPWPAFPPVHNRPSMQGAGWLRLATRPATIRRHEHCLTIYDFSLADVIAGQVLRRIISKLRSFRDWQHKYTEGPAIAHAASHARSKIANLPRWRSISINLPVEDRQSKTSFSWEAPLAWASTR